MRNAIGKWWDFHENAQVTLAICCFLFSAGLSMVLSFETAGARTKLILLFLAVAGATFLSFVRHFTDRLSSVWALSVANCVLALVLIGVHWAPEAIFGRISPHPNVASGALATLLPFSLLLIHQSTGPKRIFSSILTAPIIFAMMLLGSRGAWLALMVAILMAMVLLRLPLMHLWQRLSLLVTLLTIPLFAARLLLLFPADLLLEQSSRLILYQNVLVLTGDYPFSGAGLATFPYLYASYALLTHVPYLPHAHNLWLDILLEQGAIGLLAWLALTAIFINRYAAAQRKDPLVTAALVSLLIINLHGMVDDPLYSSRAVLLLFVPFAFVPKSTSRFLSKRGVLALGLMLACGLIAWHQPMLAYWQHNKAALRQTRTELSAYTWPEWVVQDAVRREVAMSPIIEGYESVLEIRPNFANSHRRLAQIKLSQGNYSQSLVHSEAAHTQTPWHSATRQLYGEGLLATAQIEQGSKQWRAVNTAQQQLSLRLFWYQHINEIVIADRISNVINDIQTQP